MLDQSLPERKNVFPLQHSAFILHRRIWTLERLAHLLRLPPLLVFSIPELLGTSSQTFLKTYWFWNYLLTREKSKYLPPPRFGNLNSFCTNTLDENSVESEFRRQSRLWRQRFRHWSCQTARDSSRFNISISLKFFNLDFLEATAPKTTGLRNNVRSALQSQVHKLQSRTNSNRASNRNSILSNYYSLPRSSVLLNRSFENDNSSGSHNQNIELDRFEKSFEAEDSYSTLPKRSFSKNEGVVFPGSSLDLREGANNNQVYSPGASVARTLLNKRFLGRSLKFTTDQAIKIRGRLRNESIRK